MTETRFTAEPGKPEVAITRVVDAPRDLAFRIFTDPQHVPEWWGPSYLTTAVDQMDVRPGGQWRFVQRDAEGHAYAFHGVYHTVRPPERLVYTFEFEGEPDHVLLETVVFEEHDGRTKIMEKSIFQSVEDRDGMLQAGMERGARELIERLAELLEKLRPV